MATQQTARVTITATNMTAAERGFRAIEELIVAAAMIGTIRTRRENFISAVIAKARRQLPRILPIDANDPIDAANANYPACHQARARGLRRKHKQAECRRKISHQASARIGAAAECAMKQVSSSSTDHGGGKRRPFIAAAVGSSARRGEPSHRDDRRRQPWLHGLKRLGRPDRS